jgi:hypothetical protein
VALLHERCRVLEETYEAEGTRVRVRVRRGVLDSLRKELGLPAAASV